jgi:hypothetical protein
MDRFIPTNMMAPITAVPTPAIGIACPMPVVSMVIAKAFSGEADTGSREENALKQKPRARF